MKKAIMALTIFVLLLTTLSGCSSPKSDFTAALKKVTENRQYTTNVKFQINNLSDNYIKQFGTDITLTQLKKSNLQYKISVDSDTSSSYSAFSLHWAGSKPLDLTLHALQNSDDGKAYIPVSDLYDASDSISSLLSDSTAAIFNEVLAQNKDLESKYLNFFETIQNFSNQTIDSETVDRQAEELKKIEEISGITIYSYLNNLDDQHFTAKDNGDILLELSKNEISDLINEVLKALDDDGSIITLISEINSSTQKEAESAWETQQKSIRSSLKNLTSNKTQSLDFQLTLTPDSKKGFSKATIDTNYKDTAKTHLMNYTTTIDMLDYEKVPPMPEGNEIVSKKELDKAISDGLKLYLGSTTQ
ncbi:hypothetical protein [Listeria ivanovii]|uniref:Lmo2079 family surface lipoprotein n=1 Tax=Listeria ivanovii TaxID=1638 RepID=UPI0005127537|nr:hypothetical protein [Listeria ivanovii]AIS63559.1 hypothetical protein JL53_12945 [Listeria ivanovii subsp. londoniensis]MBK1967551.1 hypothetical protein [Listeria ivanovii subsp. londoniensis]MBK1985737.1 hypothetical protein [Listeria ivanovii subsp. londoniensis]MBK1997017.1 hypothetical protein [Listeria ivanovii subsp. londoniensis]